MSTPIKNEPLQGKLQKIQEVRFLTQSTFILKFDRDDIQFKSGQYVTVGLKDSRQHREYSIYSGEEDDYIEILVREVLEGDVSWQLKNSKPGQLIEVKGPLGLFKLDAENAEKKKLLFIATGTGISPFHSFISSYKNLDYKLLHGVRFGHEAYEKNFYDPERYVLCTSGDDRGTYHGRVTAYLKEFHTSPEMEFYLCGNSRMIDDVFSILQMKHVPVEKIHSEAYF